MRKVTWSSQGPAAQGRPANGRRDQGQARQELLGPLESFHSEHAGGRGQQRTRGVQGPRQAPRPCHLSGCAPSSLPPAWLLPAPAPAAPASVSSEPPKQKRLPTPRTSCCLPPSHPFLPDSPPRRPRAGVGLGGEAGLPGTLLWMPGRGMGRGSRDSKVLTDRRPQAQAAPPVASLTVVSPTGPPALSSAERCVAVGRSLSQSGPLFPHL